MSHQKKHFKSSGNSWESGISRTPIEHLVECVLTGSVTAPYAPARINQLAQEVLAFNAGSTKAVILGGGTGLSTVTGGNSKMPDWPDDPFVGLKQEFQHLDVVVCTTDDGGSTGLLLKQLPMIGIGDLRKACLASILASNLQETYGLDEIGVLDLIRLLQKVFNYRFPARFADSRILRNPLLLFPKRRSEACPDSLRRALLELCGDISPGGKGPTIDPAGHCLGNLILASAIFKASGGRVNRSPNLREVRNGLDEVCSLIGVPPGRIHAATATPGQLLIRYLNGVEVYGQYKASVTSRGFPVDRIMAEFIQTPTISAAVCRAIENADLIIYAPGSLYTSILPILQLQPIISAIWQNKKALKILGANAWVQEGETDISYRNEARGFLISELIEAYDRNVVGGAARLFDIVLSVNLEHVPGNILRNYALEGKIPIHLDRSRVEAMGFQPVEASLFSPEHERKERVIQHDARRFALAIRSLLYARTLSGKPGSQGTGALIPLRSLAPNPKLTHGRSHGGPKHSPMLCDYASSVQDALGEKEFKPALLKHMLLDLAWANRDIQPAHLRYFRGARVVSPTRWGRSTEWDNVLGYYDPEDYFLKIHGSLISKPARLREDLLIALGESLLGRYVERRRWIKSRHVSMGAANCYEIVLRPMGKRECFLSDKQLTTFLRLARMIPDAANPGTYRITINLGEGFLPPGLLFGLTYAWYLNNAYGSTMDYDMALLHWPAKSLIPHQAKERVRKQDLVNFFRSEIFGHGAR
jgi:uncharacterized cofD-like protein